MSKEENFIREMEFIEKEYNLKVKVINLQFIIFILLLFIAVLLACLGGATRC